MEELSYLADFINNYKNELIVGASVLGWYALKIIPYFAVKINIHRREKRGEDVSISKDKFRRGRFAIFSPPPIDFSILFYSLLIERSDKPL